MPDAPWLRERGAAHRPRGALLADADTLLVGEPAGLTTDEVATLRTLEPGLAAMAARSIRQAFDVAHDVAAVAVAESYRRYAPDLVAAHPWMREMPPFCLRRILARRAWAETPAR